HYIRPPNRSSSFDFGLSSSFLGITSLQREEMVKARRDFRQKIIWYLQKNHSVIKRRLCLF
ncbi:hypothetical protein, partial [Bacillus licheniformis]|uniref:hypothetical protein n=1 Tax=Bacillus licheniformis TaxID=1402 RepID=UPI002E1E33F0|nr:hypothetical protein [Bacillus licheniformis]